MEKNYLSRVYMSSFKQCFKQKLPMSLLIYPCIPCGEDGSTTILFLASILPLVAYFVTKIAYRSNPMISEFLNNDWWVPVYFILFYAIFMSITMATLLVRAKMKTNKKSESFTNNVFNAFGIGVLILISSFASFKVYDYVGYFPVIGALLTGLQSIIHNYLGTNASKIVTSWWGISLSWITVLIPIIGPFIGSAFLLIPQNWLVTWISYMVACAFL